MELQINEAFEKAKSKGMKVQKKELAEKLWPGRKQVTQQVNMSSLCNGRTTNVTIEMVHVICGYLKCSADFLFNLK